jgi:hypothetical protein
MKPVHAPLLSSLVVVLACGGRALSVGSDGGPGAGDDGGGQSSGGQGDAVASGSGGTPSYGDSGPERDATGFPCGDTPCWAPNVCCVEGSLATATCEPAASCHGADLTCTPLTCPEGSLCCVTTHGDGTETQSACVEAGSCPSGQEQSCIPGQGIGDISDAGPPCPAGTLCTCDYVTCTCT